MKIQGALLFFVFGLSNTTGLIANPSRCSGQVAGISAESEPAASIPRPRRYVVIDTNVALRDPHFILTSPDHVVIPPTVLDELDRQKNDRSRDISGPAREFVRILNSLIGDRPPHDLLTKGYTFEDGRRIVFPAAPKPRTDMDLKINDRAIIATAIEFQDSLAAAQDKTEVVLMTMDFGMRLRALGVKVHSELLTHSTKHNIDPSADLFQEPFYVLVDPTTLPDIESELRDADDEIDRARKFSEIFKNMKVGENQFIVLVPKGFDPDSEEFFDYVSSPAKMGRAIFKYRTRVTDKGETVPVLLNVRNQDLRKLADMGVIPKNVEQILAIDQMMDEEVQFVTVVGPAGSGKTLLAIAAAFRQGPDAVKKIVKIKTSGDPHSVPRYNKVFIIRPLTVAGEEQIGFLPGEKLEKIRDFFGPIVDNMEALVDLRNQGLPESNGVAGKEKKVVDTNDFLNELIGTGVVKIEPLGFLRGRSIRNAIIIGDEFQNVPEAIVEMVVKRASTGTKYILVGDVNQIDDPKLNPYSNGLTVAAQKLGGHRIVAHVTLKKGERSELANLAIERWGR